MTLDLLDSDISRQVKEHGWYVDEQFDLEVFRQHLKPGMTFVDLGANIGFYTILARSIIGDGGRVYSFEPFPRNAELIRASIRENGFENVTLVQAAVSDSNESATFYLSPDASSEHSLLDLGFRYTKPQAALDERSIIVDVVSLDNYFVTEIHSTKIDFVKMDIEGSESRALTGMRKILENNKKMILMVEFWPNGFRKDSKDPYDFLETLASDGFDIQFIDSLNSRVYSVDPEEMKRVELAREADDSKKNDVMRQWGWYTNLICIRN